MWALIWKKALNRGFTVTVGLDASGKSRVPIIIFKCALSEWMLGWNNLISNNSKVDVRVSVFRYCHDYFNPKCFFFHFSFLPQLARLFCGQGSIRYVYKVSLINWNLNLALSLVQRTKVSLYFSLKIEKPKKINYSNNITLITNWLTSIFYWFHWWLTE